MRNLRKRLEALEKSQALKRGPEVLVVERDAVTGQWIGATDACVEPSRCVVLLYSAADPNSEMFPDNPPQVLDVSAQR